MLTIIMLLVCGVFPLIAAIKAKLGVFVSLLFYICGVILGHFLEKFIMDRGPFIKMIHSGSDINAIVLSFFVNYVIFALLSLYIYRYHSKLKKNE